MIDRLVRHFQLIVPDLAGHGLLRKPVAGYLVANCAADLGVVVDVYELKRSLIVGHSHGVMTAWPARFRS